MLLCYRDTCSLLAIEKLWEILLLQIVSWQDAFFAIDIDVALGFHNEFRQCIKILSVV